MRAYRVEIVGLERFGLVSSKNEETCSASDCSSDSESFCANSFKLATKKVHTRAGDEVDQTDLGCTAGIMEASFSSIGEDDESLVIPISPRRRRSSLDNYANLQSRRNSVNGNNFVARRGSTGNYTAGGSSHMHRRGSTGNYSADSTARFHRDRLMRRLSMGSTSNVPTLPVSRSNIPPSHGNTGYQNTRTYRRTSMGSCATDSVELRRRRTSMGSCATDSVELRRDSYRSGFRSVDDSYNYSANSFANDSIELAQKFGKQNVISGSGSVISVTSVDKRSVGSCAA